jgi:two-component system LytT family response regulator
MRAVSVDDVDSMHGYLENLLKLVGADVELVGKAATVAEGIRVIEETKPDLLFLDIELPDGTGFDLLDCLNAEDYLIVFISGQDGHARAAMDFQALIYIDKPLRASFLKEALRRARFQYNLRNPTERKIDMQKASETFRSKEPPTVYTVSNSEGFHFLPVADILYISSSGDLTTFYSNGVEPVHKSVRLKTIVKQFEIHREFMRVKSSYLINLRAVRKINKGPVLKMSDGKTIAISSQTAQEVRRRLEEL